jgi:hypothetical protein
MRIKSNLAAYGEQSEGIVCLVFMSSIACSQFDESLSLKASGLSFHSDARGSPISFSNSCRSFKVWHKGVRATGVAGQESGVRSQEQVSLEGVSANMTGCATGAARFRKAFSRARWRVALSRVTRTDHPPRAETCSRPDLTPDFWQICRAGRAGAQLGAGTPVCHHARGSILIFSGNSLAFKKQFLQTDE